MGYFSRPTCSQSPGAFLHAVHIVLIYIMEHILGVKHFLLRYNKYVQYVWVIYYMQHLALHNKDNETDNEEVMQIQDTGK